MSEQRGTIYRTGDGVIAGVCSGFAQRWGVDTGVLRFATVAFTVATAGVFALVYVALWLVLPQRDEGRFTVDVRPDSFASDTYGFASGMSGQAEREKARTDYAHVPPQSPDAAARAHAAFVHAQSPEHQAEGAVALGLGLGLVLVSVGMAFLLSSLSPLLHPVQFWPLAIVALGIVRMVVPRLHGYRIESFAMGFTAFCLGVVLIVNTTGVAFTHFDWWVAQGWPIIALAAGAFLLWSATRANGFVLCVMVLVAVFCFVGIAFCSDPGPALSVVTDQPFTKDLPMMGTGVL